ncbi:MAG: hypothetical protein AAGA09_07240 [Pseudomonadota bacterium]
MIDLKLLLTDGSVICLIVGALVAVSFCWRPRIWLRDLPRDIQEMAAPMTPGERRSVAIIGLLIVGMLFSGVVISTLRFGFAHGVLAALLHAYLIFQLFNLFDLVVLDWGMMMLIDPARPPIAGSENARGYRDFGFHAIKSLKGVVLGAPFAAMATGAAWLAAFFMG